MPIAQTSLFICICTICFSQAFAQEYIPITSSKNHWIIDQYDGADIPSIYNAYLLRFDGDTMIEQRTFQKLYRWDLKGSQPCPPEDRPCFIYDTPIQTVSQRTLVAYIHEDTLTRIVSAIAVHPAINCNGELNPIFKFNLEVGEPVDSCAAQVIGASDNPSWGIIDSIRIIEEFNATRDVLFTAGIQTYLGLPTEGTVRIVEGVGWAQYGILFSNDGRDILTDFCYGSRMDCNITSDVMDPVQPEVRIFPNPTSDFLTIDSKSTVKSIELWSLSGTLTRVSSREFQQMDVSGLAAGSYILKINFRNATSQSNLVIITH